jgi:enamine deaminase RidA (YjgF/YER057c/UK114 family)
MRNLLDNLEEADMNFVHVVFTTIYLDDLAESPAFHNIHKEYFKGSLPRRNHAATDSSWRSKG